MREAVSKALVKVLEIAKCSQSRLDMLYCHSAVLVLSRSQYFLPPVNVEFQDIFLKQVLS